MLEIWADLHLHTALSPCAEAEMTPQAIIKAAVVKGISLIGITDHNSAANVPAMLEASRGSPVTVLPGIEVQTKEEVHLLCLFYTLAEVLKWQEIVYKHLPPELNKEKLFGSQLLLDSNDRIIGKLEKMLLTSTSLAVEEVVKEVRKIGGLCIPSHIDRPAYSLISNLGFVPLDLEVAALEFSYNAQPDIFRVNHPDTGRWNFIMSSDAHWLEAIQSPRTYFKVKELSWQEIQLALAGKRGRKVVVI